MRILTFDHLHLGHHHTWSVEFVQAALALGHQVDAVVHPNVVPYVERLGDSAGTLRIVPTVGLRAGRDPRLAGGMRRWLADHTASAYDLHVDLYADDLAWCWPIPRAGEPTQVHLVHGIFAIERGMRTTKGYAAVPLWAARLRALTARGAHLVVHTERAQRYVSRLAGTGRVHFLRMPVSLGGDLATEPNHGESGVIMVVGDRADKGLDTVVTALAHAKGWTRLDVVATPSGELDRRLAPLGGRARVIPPVTGAEFDAVIRRASLIVTAYPGAVRAKMAPSGIAADALRNALPIVVSDYLAEQFPAGYDGLVTCRPDDPASLAAALSDALARIDELRDAAWMHGVPFAAHELSWSRYVRRVIDLGGA